MNFKFDLKGWRALLAMFVFTVGAFDLFIVFPAVTVFVFTAAHH